VLRQPKHDQRRKPWQSPVLLLCLGLTAYFAHHAINGRHGLEARTRLTERSSLLEFEVKSLEAVRARLERDVALLSPDLPNPDMVEEVARDVLGFVSPTDRVFARPRDGLR
jgi:cell division protein FtsB